MAGYKIGRSNKSDIVINDGSVSRDHAELTPLGSGQYTLTDTGSSFGTFVKRDGGWNRIDAVDVLADEQVMLGNFRTTPKLMMRMLGKSQGATAPRSTTEANAGERKLAAILAADVVGYSRLMGNDEAGTLSALKACRRDVYDPTVASHRGRIFKVIGDGILAEFVSVVDAVRCAVEIQSAMQNRRFDGSNGKTIDLQFRMGINIGDVIADGDDLYGDGVNIAARLESIADPGGVCIAGSVYDQIKRKLDLGYEDMGEVEVKNIDEPLRAYKIQYTQSGRVF
jgi:class 3 adenylate cyclase